jgi:hypothetical protein
LDKKSHGKKWCFLYCILFLFSALDILIILFHSIQVSGLLQALEFRPPI